MTGWNCSKRTAKERKKQYSLDLSHGPRLRVCLLWCQLEREKLTQLLFEECKCSGLFVAEQSLLALYAAGRLTGCTVDVGHGKIGRLMTALPVREWGHC